MWVSSRLEDLPTYEPKPRSNNVSGRKGVEV